MEVQLFLSFCTFFSRNNCKLSFSIVETTWIYSPLWQFWFLQNRIGPRYIQRISWLSSTLFFRWSGVDVRVHSCRFITPACKRAFGCCCTQRGVKLVPLCVVNVAIRRQCISGLWGTGPPCDARGLAAGTVPRLLWQSVGGSAWESEVDVIFHRWILAWLGWHQVCFCCWLCDV